jgi:hypothetical protein
VVVAEREQTTRKLHSRERRVTKLESTLAELRAEPASPAAAPLSPSPAEPEREAQAPEAEAEAEAAGEPQAQAEEAAEQAEHFLYFVPRAGQGYELVEQDGVAPAIGNQVELEGEQFEVTRHSRSPLPFDRRVCVYLRGPG